MGSASHDPEAHLLALAQAVTASPLWKEMPRAVLVVRPEPQPTMALLGHFNEADTWRVEALRERLSDSQTPLRYVSYAQAEKDCERLALKLIDHFGRDELKRFRFTAVPRGGLIVLGMLSYLLNLTHSQLEGPHSLEQPLVVVDDLAISGSRFGRFLKRCEHQQLVFAHLYSHPDLRAAILTQEPRVMACLSSHDLHDYAPERLGEAYPAWREAWQSSYRGQRYWGGQTEHVCFAWNEPDYKFWNSATESAEAGWRIVPSDLCLKNRPALGAKPERVQVQPEGKGPLKPSARVIFGEVDGQIVIGNLETEASFGLKDVAADMWRTVVSEGFEEGAAAALAKDYEVDEAMLRADLHAFVEDLLARGLLEEHDRNST